MALREGPLGPSAKLPEQEYVSVGKTAALPASIIVGSSAVAAGGLWWAFHWGKNG